MDSSVIVNKHESQIAEILLRADGILVYHPRPNLMIDLDAARLILEYGRILVDHPVPVLVHMGPVRRVTREARAFFTSDDYTQLAAQSALLVSSPISRVISNFFIGLNKPRYPLRIFTDETSAVAWLREFLG